MNDYTDEQIDILLNGYLRPMPRPTPWKEAATAMGVALTYTAYDRLLWGIWTGYTTKGEVRVHNTTLNRHKRHGYPWLEREEAALLKGLAGAGQKRKPPVDVTYMAAVLARSEEEVKARWKQIGPAQGRESLGLV